MAEKIELVIGLLWEGGPYLFQGIAAAILLVMAAAELAGAAFDAMKGIATS